MSNTVEDMVLYSILITLLGVSVALLLGASLLWLSTKVLRFRKPSFWASLGCVFIMLSVAWAVEAIVFLAMSFPDPTRHPQPSWQAVLATAVATIGFGGVAGVISVVLLFREPVWKVVAAIGLVVVVESLFVGVTFGALLFSWLFSWLPHHML